jgi:hypothetical protein
MIRGLSPPELTPSNRRIGLTEIASLGGVMMLMRIVYTVMREPWFALVISDTVVEIRNTADPGPEVPENTLEKIHKTL